MQRHSGSHRRVLGRGVIIATHEEGLRRLVLHDERCIQSMLGIHLNNNEAAGLEPKTQALVRLGGLVTMGGAPTSYHWAAAAALDAGASAEDVVGALVAVAPISGLARVISAIPEVALAIGYDIDQAFEALDRDSRG
jgi:4-carboxymuconolactone decarboxylase